MAVNTRSGGKALGLQVRRPLVWEVACWEAC